MQWLTERLVRARGDRGASLVLIVILTPIVLLGIGAFVVDVGSFYVFRANTQNGADAGAVAIATACAKTGCDTSAGDAYAAQNAIGDLSSTSKVSHTSFPCGHDPGGVLPPCRAGSETGTVCPDASKLPADANYVDLQVTTANPVAALFGRAFGAPGRTIGACAQASWGPLGGGTGLALGMSLCAWEAATGGTASPTYATPEPPYPSSGWPSGYTAKVDSKHAVVANVGGENVVQIHGDAKPCNDSSSGLNVPGGFAWLSDSANGQEPAHCVVQTDANGYVYSNPGGLGGQNSDCANALKDVYSAGTPIPNDYNPIYLPVFDLACSSNGTLTPPPPVPASPKCPRGMPDSSYHIAGYASFVLTGYEVSPISGSSMITRKDPCKGSFDCVYGMFTKGLTTETGDICTGASCADFGGPTVVKLTG
jgi:hypothetical protein